MPTFLLGLDTEPMEARSVDALPTGEGWQFEPKWDGFRCLVFKAGQDVDLRAKSGKSLSRYFPEMVQAVRSAKADNFVLDGELTVPIGDTLSFGALQDRVHPAESRIRKLAAETPGLLVLFDCLATAATGSLLGAPLTERRAALERLMPDFGKVHRTSMSPLTVDLAEAQRWLNAPHGALDGVVGKRTGGSYAAGERAMVKVKRLRSADCVVGGFRYAKGTHEVGSLLLGLFNDQGKLDHVGFTSAISNADRRALTVKLEALAGAPGFTGDSPGGPSRWSNERSAEWQPLRTELVVEVGYDQVTDGRFRHGTKLLRWRPDKAARQCTREQLQQELRPGQLVNDILNHQRSRLG
ncbi:MAG TPA: ATP-dependent DNA ligase [Bradyrhizobium sp.]|nr:ATP-dependent DNA ligase [Bradyrhizobium sp.]